MTAISLAGMGLLDEARARWRRRRSVVALLAVALAAGAVVLSARPSGGGLARRAPAAQRRVRARPPAPGTVHRACLLPVVRAIPTAPTGRGALTPSMRRALGERPPSDCPVFVVPARGGGRCIRTSPARPLCQ